MDDTEYFKEAITFFKQFQWLYNTPVTRILVESSLLLFPDDWMETLTKLDNDALNMFVAKNQVHSNWPVTLLDFINKCIKLNKLPSPVISLSPMQLPQSFRKKLSPKKQHEILNLSRLVYEQCSSKNLSLIVDLGAGLGYICQLMNHLYGYRILGLESNPQNVETAKFRQRTFFPDSLPSVKYVCCDIGQDSSKTIELILQQHFEKTENFCLIGLHACGDLSVNMTKLFLEIKSAQLVILVSCCYHKLSMLGTNNESQETNQKEYFNHFPLSTCMKNASDFCGADVGEFFRRPFMRLACQETSDRWLAMLENDHNEHSFHVLARAVLELYGVSNGFSLKKLVRKATRKSQCTSFENYLQDCMHRYKYEKDSNPDGKVSLNIPWDDKMKCELIELWRNNTEKQKSIELYTALQLILQHTAESLVLYDRVCFLKENNLDAKIIPTMDRSLSPRSYAIVSIKIQNCQHS